MLTPRFELSQTESDVAITIHAPYANIKDTEVYVEGTDLRFYSSPYYLRLKLPGEIVENDESSGSYDCDKGDFFMKFSKVNKGEYFENLDMITTLLSPPKENKDFLVPKVQVISNPAANLENEGLDADREDDEEDGEEIDWSLPQSVPSNEPTLLLNPPKYGFANKISGALQSFDAAWLKEIIELPTPDSVPMGDRQKMREAQELEAFSEDHYMADLVSEECVEPFTSFVPEWENLKVEEVALNDKEKDLLKELPNKEYLLDSDEIKVVLYSMVDILFGSCYNNRITLGENNSESSWDINKLSSTLSWLQTFSSFEDVVKACVRRSLCYPLCRNWNLSMKTLEDVKKVIKLGKKYIIKRFCEIHELFNDSYEPRYLLNQLYIKDYLIWLQQASPASIESMVAALENVKPKKGDMGLDLEELEVAAFSVLNESLVLKNEIDDLSGKLSQVTVNNTQNKISCSSEESDSDTDSDSDSTSSSSASSESETLDSDDSSDSEAT